MLPRAELVRSLRAALPARDNDGVGAALNQQPGLESRLTLTGTHKCRDPRRLAADIDSLTEPWHCGHVSRVAVGKGSIDIPHEQGIPAGPVQSEGLPRGSTDDFASAEIFLPRPSDGRACCLDLHGRPGSCVKSRV